MRPLGESSTYDSEADVALCLALAKLSRGEVEVIADISLLASFPGPPWRASAARRGPLCCAAGPPLAVIRIAGRTPTDRSHIAGE